jgi:hypothetical protein
MFFDQNEAGLPAVEVKGSSRSRKTGSITDKGDERPARNRKDEDAVQIIFPKQGGYVTIPASSYPTVIDFYNGDVVVPDGTGEELETSLSTEGLDYIRSLSIESSENVTIRFDRKNRAIVNYGRVVRFRHIKVRVLEIFATRDTGVKVWASTKPEGGIEEISMDRVVVAEKQIPYRVFQIDLSQEHTDTPLGMGKLANSLTILDAPSYFTYKLNSPENDPIPAEKGQSYNGIVFSEIYVNNIAASGMAKIHAAWID